MTCPGDDDLIALSDGELGEKQAHIVRTHAHECTRCKSALRELAVIGGDLRAPVHRALGGASAEGFADEVLLRLDRPRPAARDRSWPRWPFALAAAAAIPLLASAGVRSARKADTGEWTARGAASDDSTSRTLIRFGSVAGTTFDPIADGAVIASDAVFAAETAITVGTPRFLLAFLVDAAGDRHWIYPVYEPGAPPPSSIALPETTTPRVLGSMVRLDHPAPGPGRLVAIVLPRSESVEHVERAPLDRLSREALVRHYPGSLVVVTPVEIRP